MAKAHAEANAVRALFTGYALAARQTKVQVKTVEKIKEVVKEAQKAARAKAPLKRPKAAVQSDRPPRMFKRPKSWDDIKQQAGK